jgi:two-component system nitrogen regulation response regulator NtrX
VIRANNIPAPFNGSTDIGEGFESAFVVDTLKEARNKFERAFIENKLKKFAGNISQTAEAIGIERSNLHKKIKAYGLTSHSK